MIRINLLGVSKQKKGKRAAVALPGGGGAPNIMVIAGVVAALTVGGNYLWYWLLQRDAQNLQNQISLEEDKNRRLSDIKTRYLELDKSKKGPSELLTTIADTVNQTDAVWLSKMHEDGNNVNLEGVALSVNAVARLMDNLRRTGYFRSVEIKEAYQDDVVKDVQAFVFTLVCERQPSQPQKS